MTITPIRLDAAAHDLTLPGEPPRADRERRALTIARRAPPMAELMGRLVRAARTASTVLLVGETGTGKSFLAERLHELSPRAAGPFVACDCGALSEELIASELFGHARGAFSGAVAARAGLIQSAAGGTLFLDEIGELPLAQQVKLLTVLDKKQVRRVGDDRPQEVDFRLIAATNRDLREQVREGTFREELYFRLNVIKLCVPPLRERGDEILPLAEACLRELGGRRLAFAPAATELLLRHPWPGNVRELRHAIESAVAQADGDWLEPEDFELRVDAGRADDVPGGILPVDPAVITREQLLAALVANGCNRTRAAKALGRSREWFRQKCIALAVPLGR